MDILLLQSQVPFVPFLVPGHRQCNFLRPGTSLTTVPAWIVEDHTSPLVTRNTGFNAHIPWKVDDLSMEGKWIGNHKGIWHFRDTVCHVHLKWQSGTQEQQIQITLGHVIFLQEVILFGSWFAEDKSLSVTNPSWSVWSLILLGPTFLQQHQRMLNSTTESVKSLASYCALLKSRDLDVHSSPLRP